MQFETINPPKVADVIVNQIEQLILEGVLKPGERLPPERELAQKFNVSRPSLREAITTLKSRGLLQSRRGGGSYVVDVIAPGLTNPLIELLKNHPKAMFDVLELRHALEEVAAYFAALRATGADREILQRRFAELEAIQKGKHEPQHDAVVDAGFHLAIADASHNVALIHVMRGLFDLLLSHINRSLERLYTREDNYVIIHSQHQAVLEAVLKRDPEAARQAAHVHLAFVETTLRELDEEATRQTRAQRRLQDNLNIETST
ncbi:MAG TPA: GntR family transcriptional regulator [Candidatus Competibacteraceae bacterium]|nr:GntR family transcriptional regulator [Candidatus Competibacteraceae bacterium]HRY17149.1 GntR family transcriptional regulator [Candidatus Competibacteraceae bacterium]